MNGNKGLVYSTEHGRMCPDCSKPVGQCHCKAASNAPRGDGNVRVGRETAGRKGKGVTTVTGLAMNDEELKKFATELKQKCGSGGTVKDGVIEIQGEHRDKILEYFKGKGIAAKKSGG